MTPFYLIFSLFVLFSAKPTTYELEIQVDGIEEPQGKLMLKLQDEKGRDIKKFIHPVDEVVETFSIKLKPGTYALACFHDENDNDELDTGFTGIPSENYAFSNNVRGTFGPPDLADQLFTIKGKTKLKLHLE